MVHDLRAVNEVVSDLLDIIICLPDRVTCQKDSIKLLQILAEKGHKAMRAMIKDTGNIQLHCNLTW